MSGDRVWLTAEGRSLDGLVPAELVVIHEARGTWVFHDPDGRGVRLCTADTVRLCGRSGTGPGRARPSDRWRDVDGTSIPVGARVRQVAVNKDLGAAPTRLHWLGQAAGRGSFRVRVHFDRDPDRLVSVRPHLLRVVTAQAGGESDEWPSGWSPVRVSTRG